MKSRQIELRFDAEAAHMSHFNDSTVCLTPAKIWTHELPTDYTYVIVVDKTHSTLTMFLHFALLISQN